MLIGTYVWALNAIIRILLGTRPELIQVPLLNTVPDKSYLVHEGLICSCVSSACAMQFQLAPKPTQTASHPPKAASPAQGTPAHRSAPEWEMGADTERCSVLGRSSWWGTPGSRHCLPTGILCLRNSTPGMTHTGVGTAMGNGVKQLHTTPHSKGLGWPGYNMQGKWRKVESKKEDYVFLKLDMGSKEAPYFIFSFCGC